MKKRILSLAAVLAYAAVSVFGSNVFADSGYAQRVKLKSYQPAVKTLVYDDDFNDVLITGEKHEFDSNDSNCRTTVSEYNVPSIAEMDGYKVDESSEDVSVSLDMWKTVRLPKAIKSNKLVVSFDIYATEGKGLGYRFVNKGNIANSKYAFYFNAWATGANIEFGGTKFAYIGTNALNGLLNHWVNNTMIFERVLNSAGTGYDVYLREFYLDGVSYDISGSVAATDIDWWTDDPNTYNFYIEPINAARYLDNVLVYEPVVDDNMTSQVAVPSYLPKIGTLVLDDTFESSTTSGTKVTSSYQYSIKEFSEGTTTDGIAYGLMTSGNNKYGTFAQYAKLASKITGPVDSDKFVVSFDVKASVKNGFNIYFGGNTSNLALRLFFDKYDDADTANSNNWKLYLCDGSNSWTTRFAAGYAVPKDAFTKISVICQRVKDADGVDKAILSKAYVNGVELSLLDNTNTRYLATNWFSTASGSSPVAIGNFGVAGYALDNVIAYAPLKFEANKSEISSDGSTAEITFNDTIGNIDGAAVAAVDMFGNTINSTLTAEGSTLTATFDSPVNIKDKVYTFTVSGVKNGSGETADTFTALYGTGIASIDVDRAEVKINNNLEIAIDGNFIVAAYDSSNNFLGATAAAVNVPVDITGTVSNATLPTTSATPAKYKLFIWSKDSIMPYCSGTEIIPVQ